MGFNYTVLLLDILDVLKNHTDNEKGINQKELIDKLEQDYGYSKLNRGTVRRNLEKVMDHHDVRGLNPIKATETMERKNGEVLSSFVYEHTFTHEELYLMIDSILFSKHIPSSKKKNLIQKLEGLSSKYFNSPLSRIHTLPNNEPMNNQLFETIEQLSKAINENKKVSFYYHQYVVDDRSTLRLEYRPDDQGNDREYIINPYELVAANGRYYMICNYDKYDNLAHYRVERITDVLVLNEERKPIENIKGYERGLDLTKYMREHIYLFAGDIVTARMRFQKRILDEFIDWFGTEDIVFYDQTDDEVTVSVRVNRTAMRKWALQYALHVTVIYPDDLVADIKKDLQKAWDRYK